MKNTKLHNIALFVVLLGSLLTGHAQTASASVTELRKQIEAPWKAKDWGTVEALYRQIIATGDTDISNYRGLRIALSQQGKTQEAMQLRLSIVQRPDAKSDDHNSVCWAYLEQNKPLEARPYCQKAVDLYRTNWAALTHLGHSWLLAGNKTQAMSQYRKSLAQIGKEDDLKQGPLSDFDLFIKNGWFVADAQAAKAWFEQGWKTLQELNAVPRITQTGQEAEVMRLALKAMNDSAALLGDDASLTKAFARRHVINAIALAKRQMKESPNAAIKDTVDSAFAAVVQHISQEEIWSYWEELALAYSGLGQHDKALALEENILAGRTTRFGTDHPATLGSMNNLAFTYRALSQHDKALALEQKILAAPAYSGLGQVSLATRTKVAEVQRASNFTLKSFARKCMSGESVDTDCEKTIETDLQLHHQNAELARLKAEKARLDGEKARLDGEKARLDGEKARLDGELAFNKEIIKLHPVIRSHVASTILLVDTLNYALLHTPGDDLRVEYLTWKLPANVTQYITRILAKLEAKRPITQDDLREFDMLYQEHSQKAVQLLKDYPKATSSYSDFHDYLVRIQIAHAAVRPRYDAAVRR